MAEFTVEIAGEDRDQLAQELQDSFTAHQGQVQVFAETERAVDPIAIVSVVCAGVQAADLIWKWWQGKRERTSTVTIRTAAGHVIELSNVDQKHIAIMLDADE